MTDDNEILPKPAKPATKKAAKKKTRKKANKAARKGDAGVAAGRGRAWTFPKNYLEDAIKIPRALTRSLLAILHQQRTLQRP